MSLLSGVHTLKTSVRKWVFRLELYVDACVCPLFGKVTVETPFWKAWVPLHAGRGGERRGRTPVPVSDSRTEHGRRSDLFVLAWVWPLSGKSTLKTLVAK